VDGIAEPPDPVGDHRHDTRRDAGEGVDQHHLGEGPAVELGHPGHDDAEEDQTEGLRGDPGDDEDPEVRDVFEDGADDRAEAAAVEPDVAAYGGRCERHSVTLHG
jgi:hypothetical protein